MEWTYPELTPSLIPNTQMWKGINSDGVHKTYRIKALDGYVLHDTNYDTPIPDAVTGEPSDEVILGYHPNVVSCSASYDFAPLQMQDEAGNTVTAYGNRQFFTKLATDVPADQIFGTVEPPHEVM